MEHIRKDNVNFVRSISVSMKTIIKYGAIKCFFYMLEQQGISCVISDLQTAINYHRIEMIEHILYNFMSKGYFQESRIILMMRTTELLEIFINVHMKLNRKILWSSIIDLNVDLNIFTGIMNKYSQSSLIIAQLIMKGYENMVIEKDVNSVIYHMDRLAESVSISEVTNAISWIRRNPLEPYADNYPHNNSQIVKYCLDNCNFSNDELIDWIVSISENLHIFSERVLSMNSNEQRKLLFLSVRRQSRLDGLTFSIREKWSLIHRKFGLTRSNLWLENNPHLHDMFDFSVDYVFDHKYIWQPVDGSRKEKYVKWPVNPKYSNISVEDLPHLDIELPEGHEFCNKAEDFVIYRDTDQYESWRLIDGKVVYHDENNPHRHLIVAKSLPEFISHIADECSGDGITTTG